ncbi:MAG TPA: STAS/SEC14 domain-containing protein [Cyclobacteriaceae bacterium]
MQLYLEKDYITIEYDEVNNILVQKWMLAPAFDEFREGMNHLVEAIVHFKTGRLLSDTTKLGALHSDNQAWVATVWFERAVKAGYSRVAIIVPSDIFTQMSVEDAISQVTNPIPFSYFDNPVEALEWMKKY